MDWGSELAYIDGALGPAPRAVGWLPRFRHRLNRPAWTRDTSEFNDIFTARTPMLREGRLIWGSVVKANEVLWRRDMRDARAQVAFSLDSRCLEDLTPLLRTVVGLDHLRSASRFPVELQEVHRMLADDNEGGHCFPVPESLCFGAPIVLSSIMIYRRDLPGKHLVSRIVPLLYHPKCKRVMVAPRQYMSAELIERLLDQDEF